jgi:lysyl-tRNA synthetase, class II
MSDIPYTYDRSHSAAHVHEQYGDAVETGETTETTVSVAGRVMLRRGQGKLAFVTLADSSGRIQLFAPADVTPNFEQFTELSLGDWIGASGKVMKTRKGELSVQVTDWVVLAKARRPFPDKWHGLSDVDMRYRQRYVDLWVTEESRRVLQMRSRMVSLTRRWLEDRGFMEVETPILQPLSGGAIAKPFVTHHNALDMDMFLRIAPELYLKRLIVGGFERVFEIGRVFRNEGISPRHNPDFTTLELYQAYGDYHDMMWIFEHLVSYLAEELTGSMKIMHQGREIDFTPPWPRRKLVELISENVGVAVSLDAPIDELRAVAAKHMPHVDDAWGAGKLLLELYEKTTETKLWDPTFVVDMPKEVSPLARDHRTDAGMAEHFDLVVAGRELGPAYSELIDPDEQRLRFEEQLRQREAGDEEAMSVIDDDYIRALEYGMPPTGGLGMGIDRLAMLLADADNIRDVLLFPALRPEQ